MTTVEARKKAPPETSESINLRTKIIVSFWVVILFFGLPTWLKTTEIYRASLPLENMLALSEGEVLAPYHTFPSTLLIPSSSRYRSYLYRSGLISLAFCVQMR